MKNLLLRIINWFRNNKLVGLSLTAFFLWKLYQYRFRIQAFLSRFGLMKKTWINPVIGPVTSKFGARVAPTEGASTDHKGVDIGVPLSTDCKCPKDGKITDWSWSESGGTRILIDHGDYKTAYLHLSAVGWIQSVGGLTVDNWLNAEVKQGEIFAQTGSGGTGPHLHFEIMDKNNKRLDPLMFFDFKKEPTKAVF